MLTPAAVLIGIARWPDGMSVLLTQRTAHLADHAGQISLPGGRIEPSDPDAVYAALREAEEEIGLPPAHVEIVGRLDTYITGTGFEIAPVVGLVRVPFEQRPDPFEVAEAVRGAARLHPRSRAITSAARASSAAARASSTSCPIENRYIWGATAAMLVNLAEILGA